MSKEISHLVFDLGGVIVELSDTPILNGWLADDNTAETIWQKWLTSTAPRSFESGQIDKEEFATLIVEELSLGVTEQDFLKHFTSLPIGPYSGALERLHTLKDRYTTALFSNSNELHWQRKMGEMKLKDAFHYHFASHLMGKVKPDIDAFQDVVKTLGVPESQILFFDDNQLNVDAAKLVGLQAVRVNGFSELEESLKKYEIE